MNVGLVGLGKMGNAIAHRILNSGYYYKVFGFDIDKNAIEQALKIGVEIEKDLPDLAERADVIWLMLPAGEIIDQVIDLLLPHLKDGDIIFDGGNSHYRDSIKRAERLKKHGIYFLDCGVSGGLQGEKYGFSLTIGGEKEAYNRLIPLFEAVSHKNGFSLIGSSGAGHYVKMVHNGIEYALLQAYAQGFNLLNYGEYGAYKNSCENKGENVGENVVLEEKEIDLQKVAQVWQNGSVIRSFILGLIGDIYADEVAAEVDFSKVGPEIYGGQTGKWALQEAQEKGINFQMLEKALEIREESKKGQGDYSTKLVALLRNKFGGHEYNNPD